MTTSVATGVAGAAIGFVVGGGPAGAAWGWAIGSTIGNVLDPQVIRGPSLGDIQQQTSQEGVPIPIVYGLSPPMSGNVWASAPPRVVTETSSGKGGPRVENEVIYRTYAVEFCEGPIGGFVRVWRNNIKVYDALDPVFTEPDFILGSSDLGPSRNEVFLEKARFYLGAYDQDASPDLEAIYGVGTTAANRGIAYMVIVDEDCTREAGVIPQWKVQVTTEVPPEAFHYESPVLWPWVSGAIADPRHPLNEHVYTFSGSTAAGGSEEGATGGTDACADVGKNIFGLGSFDTLSGAVEALNAAWADPLLGDGRVYSSLPAAYSRTGDNNLNSKFSAPPTSELNTPGAQQSAYQRYTFLHLPLEEIRPTVVGGATSGMGNPTPGEVVLFVTSAPAWDNVNGRSMTGLSFTPMEPPGPPPAPFVFWGGVASSPFCGATTQQQRYMTYLNAVARAERMPGRPTEEAEQVSGTFRVLRSFLNTAGANTGNPRRYPTGPCLTDSDPNYDNREFWEDAYERALANGLPGVVPGWVYGVDYPMPTTSAYRVPGNHETYVIATLPPVIARGEAVSVTMSMPWTTKVSWSIVSGALPPGLSLDATTGLLSGSPTSSSSYNFVVQGTGVQDGGSTVVRTRAFSVLVDDYPAVLSTAATATPAGTTSRSVPLGIAPSVGDLIFIVSSFATGAYAVTAPPGFTLARFPGTGNNPLSCHYKVSDGSEGDTIVFTGVASARVMQHVAFVIKAGTFNASRIELAGQSGSTSLAGTTLTPSWGSAKNLWISMMQIAVNPSSYLVTGVPLNRYRKIFQGADGLDLQFGVGTDLVETASLSPGSFSFSPAFNNFGWTRVTIAIGPP